MQPSKMHFNHEIKSKTEFRVFYSVLFIFLFFLFGFILGNYETRRFRGELGHPRSVSCQLTIKNKVIIPPAVKSENNETVQRDSVPRDVPIIGNPKDRVMPPMDWFNDEVRISDPWFNAHGCPRAGFVRIDCNHCYGCGSAGSKEHVYCGYMMCLTDVNDYYKPGDYCRPNKEFFSMCKICRCNDKGNNAECDDSVCEKYYPHVSLDYDPQDLKVINYKPEIH